MGKQIFWIVTGILLGLLIIPVIVAHLRPEEGRTLQGVDLDSTSYQEVRFRNEAQGLDLGGLLFFPEGSGPFPAVVIIHGSGSSHRDNPWYLKITTDLQKNGIAVLLPDKRGSELSQGDWRSASFQDLATDTLAAISFLQAHYPDQVTEIGILGASQGGQIAPPCRLTFG